MIFLFIEFFFVAVVGEGVVDEGGLERELLGFEGEVQKGFGGFDHEIGND